MKPKNTICLWFDKGAEEAATFYAATFPDSAVTAVHKAPGDYPSGKKGDVITVEFTVVGIPCVGLNGGPAIKHNEVHYDVARRFLDGIRAYFAHSPFVLETLRRGDEEAVS